MANKIIVDGHYIEPIGVQKIIKGVVREVENPITHEISQVGDGQILWDITQNREQPFFALCLKTKKFRGE